jgi:proteasome lid subunit RPN8/RPN11
VYLPREIYEEMITQAVAELPNECCGLLAGHIHGRERTAQVARRYPLVNGAASPTEYWSEPAGHFAADREMRQLGLVLLAIYHSHPSSDPIPSRKDLERNYYGPDIVNFIISLKDGRPRMRGWWLSERTFQEAEWQCDISELS